MSLALHMALMLTCWYLSSHLKHRIISFQPFLVVLLPISSNFCSSPMVNDRWLSAVGTIVILFKVIRGASLSSTSFHAVVTLSLDFNVSLSRTCYVARSCVGFKPPWNCRVMPSWTFTWLFLWMTSLFWPIVSLCTLSFLSILSVSMQHFYSSSMEFFACSLEAWLGNYFISPFGVFCCDTAVCFSPFELSGVLEHIFVCVYFSRP